MIKLLFPWIHVLHYIWIRRLCLFPSGKCLSFPQPAVHPTPCLRTLHSTLNKNGQRGRLVVYFVCNLLPSRRLTWHIINSYKDERPICTLCLWIELWSCPASAHSLTPPHMNYSQCGSEGHHFEMWPGQQITFCFGNVVKVNVSQVQTRVTYSWLSHFADWMTRRTESEEKEVKGFAGCK